MNYWLDLFTGTTWDEFRKAGASVSGFRYRMRKIVSKIQQGDVLLCYMTGVKRWVGALEVLGPSNDDRAIWSVADFPERLAVKPLVMVEAEYGVPMEHLEGRVSFYEGQSDRGKYKGIVRGSPRLMKNADAELILEMIRDAEASPKRRRVDPKQLGRKPLFKAETKRGRKAVETLVTIPDRDEPEQQALALVSKEDLEDASTPHTQVQGLLLELGAEMGFDIWVARNDRGKPYNGRTLGEMPGTVTDLPTQFNEATNKTVELIDVLWLKGNSILAAFEVECTTSIYSGLLRMSDLMALQPNLNIKLYIVAPDERKAKVEQEILRPTFKLRERPVSDVCAFLSISELSEKVAGARKLGLLASLKPEFLEDVAEYFAEEGTD